MPNKALKHSNRLKGNLFKEKYLNKYKENYIKEKAFLVDGWKKGIMVLLNTLLRNVNFYAIKKAIF